MPRLPRPTLILVAAAFLLASCASVRKADPAWAAAPRTVTDPDAGTPYLKQQVFVHSGQDDIASVLLLPAGEGRHPAVVFISGSGDGLNNPDSPLPRKLVTRGHVVLMLGKKGVGASGGDWRNETFEDRARNVRQALAWLAARPDVDPQRVGMYGHSQGGYIAAMVAAQDSPASYAVLSSGPAQRVREQIAADYMYTRMADDGLPPDEARASTRRRMWLLDAGMSLCPLVRVHYLCGIYQYDPVPSLERARIPILAMFGERDNMAPPAENREPMERALRRAGVPYQVKVFAGGNHMFWLSKRGTPSEYAALGAGRSANFAHAEPGNPTHEAMARMLSNRVQWVDGYFETVLDFIAANGRPAGTALANRDNP